MVSIMAKDLFGGKTIEVPCRVCGKLFPEYKSGNNEQLYCSKACEHVAHNRARREKWRKRREIRFEAIHKYAESLGTHQQAVSTDIPSVDLFGTKYNPKGSPLWKKEKLARWMERNRSENIKARDEYRKLKKEYRSEHRSWSAMRNRCLNPSQEWYHRYGGRGITICERWLNSFENFIADMGRKPSSEYTLERKDNDGNYEPSNCKWATVREQAKNRGLGKKQQRIRKILGMIPKF
jgi:hypothetical protein